ncbi:Ras GTPase-activating rng2 [Hyphodiscus hymeniophilus]|uniref:Ras GTPase-activating rng2 n=1 Tax=Hyphodiscus hymeniophilus TaxID=353542 RepID=A0A9P6VP05_9HELO|nr:Ras GTPase-activating rng2 [Hyphodiscus hymeniophilus]
MSYRYTLRPTPTAEYSSPAKRQPSNASTVSTAYSNSSGAFNLSRTSTLSSTTSSGYAGHKRGQSEATGMSHSIIETRNSPESAYKNVRQSLRPLPQPPAASSPVRNQEGPHSRGYSVDVPKMSYAEEYTRTPNPQPSAQLNSTILSRAYTEDYKSTPTPRTLSIRPNSMVLSRTDSLSLTSRSQTTQHQHSPLTAPDLQDLQKSSTSQLRTLSKFAQNASPDDFSITNPAQEVVGLHGRRRLQRSDTARAGKTDVALNERKIGYGWEGRNWMDKQRQFLQAYEYLCHIGEAKEWIEDILKRPIPPIVQLEEALRDGVTLAEIVDSLYPERRLRIFRHPRLQYRHSDNIAIFFRFLAEIELPDLFRFELIDLYEKKNTPKVIYCIHALSWLLFRKGIVDFRIGNLVGQLEFEHHELEAMQKGLDKAGISMPSFGNMGADFGVEEPEPEPVESEEDRIERELGENAMTVLELQAQIRGAAVRMQLGDTMQRLWDSEALVVELQSRIRGDFSRQIAEYRLNMRNFAINLQSHARGFLVRQRQHDQESFWKSREGDVLKLQSLIRAKKARDEVRITRSQLLNQGIAVKNLQATIRGFLARKHVAAQARETKAVAGPIKSLQAAVRGMLVRTNVTRDHDRLSQEETSISAIQAFSRAMLTRNQMLRQREALQASTPIWRALQAVAKGNLIRQQVEITKQGLKVHSPQFSAIQAFIRAAAVRREVATTLSKLQREQPSVLDMQRLVRGMLLRQRVTADYEALAAQIPNITRLQSFARGGLLRQRTETLLDELRSHSAEISQLQALLRAVLLRNDIGMVLGELEAEEEYIIATQAAAKAFLVRLKFAEKQRFFKENMEKVVKLQSFVRGKLQGEAYKSLTTGKNPPVNTVKNFVHLLNDSDFDFNEEIEFERLRKTVVQQVRQNEMAEQYIDQLDIKIALLVKNKITLDEVVKHQKNFGGHSGNLLVNTSMVSGNQFDLKALNKNSRKKLESYQQLFFTLQTQPQYLARLFKRIREQGTAERDCKRIETLMMGLFGYAQKRREEYYLLKLIARSVKEEVDGVNNVQEYMRGNFFWSKLLANYTRSPRDRKYLREILGPLITTNIIEDPALDLESDPMQIYRSAINNEELRTGRPSQRPLEIPREIAIKDPETRDMFIDHLRDLREISDQFLLALDGLLHKMPYGIRFVCQQMFESLVEHFPREPQRHLLLIVGHWLWKFYLQPALTSPESMGVVEKQLTPLQKRNLGEVAKVLNQVASGRLFGGENIYLQPLNAYVGDAIKRMSLIFSNIISVPDAENTFDIDEFNDLYARTKPTLYIKMADIFSIHNLIAADLPHICPNRDDMLREIVQELGSAKNNEAEMLGVTSTEIQMNLNPKLHDIDDPEADVKALFMETKRCVLYIIRVQSGPNLMEILVRPVTREDDNKWHSLLREEFAEGNNTRGAYSDANTLVDIKSMSYKELKRTALENIMNLEQMGRISRHNFYQDILNAIALDIRTKSRRRVQRQRELEGVRLTLGNLAEKAEWLESQRKSYDNYIEQAMMTLQKKGHQYNHEKELERSGRKPKFGSFKYSARTLSDKGVLVSWKGHSDKEWDKINLTISCDEVGVFFIEGSKGSIQIPGASAQVPMDSLLAAQFANHQYMDLFEGGKEGVRIYVPDKINVRHPTSSSVSTPIDAIWIFANTTISKRNHTPRPAIMRDLLPPRIFSVMLPVTFARYVPVHDQQGAPTPTPAVIILQQNSGCGFLSSALSVCTSLTPGFTLLPPSQQAPCLCYSSTSWTPNIFDEAVKTCADYASTALPSVYTPIVNLENFCINVGNIDFGLASASAINTAGTFNAACDLVNSLIEVCTSRTPGFVALPATNQASCLCYATSSTWAPTVFDSATLRPSATASSVASKTPSKITARHPSPDFSNQANIVPKTSINITISSAATNTAIISENDRKPKIVTEGDVIGMGFLDSVSMTPKLTEEVSSDNGSNSLQIWA